MALTTASRYVPNSSDTRRSHEEHWCATAPQRWDGGGADNRRQCSRGFNVNPLPQKWSLPVPLLLRMGGPIRSPKHAESAR